MNSRACAVLVLAALVGCRTTPPRATGDAEDLEPSRAELPGLDEALAREIESDCLACHTGDLLLQQRLTRKQWTATVRKMHGWGAPLPDDRLDAAAAALAVLSSTGATTFRPRFVRAEDASRAIAPQPDGPLAGGRVERGVVLYAAACAACHGPDGRGGELGVNLADRFILDQAAAFAARVRQGRGRMPAFDTLTDGDLANLLAYLRGR